MVIPVGNCVDDHLVAGIHQFQTTTPTVEWEEVVGQQLNYGTQPGITYGGSPVSGYVFV